MKRKPYLHFVGPLCVVMVGAWAQAGVAKAGVCEETVGNGIADKADRRILNKTRRTFTIRFYRTNEPKGNGQATVTVKPGERGHYGYSIGSFRRGASTATRQTTWDSGSCDIGTLLQSGPIATVSCQKTWNQSKTRWRTEYTISE